MFSTPLIQASNAYVLYKSVCYTMHTSMCYTRQCVVYTTDTSYEIRGLQTPCHVSCTPLMQCTNVRVQHMSVCWYTLRPCATHVRVLCTLLIQATHVQRRPCVAQSCEPLIPATSPSVVFTTVTSYTRPRNFLVHFFITFVICTFCMHSSQHVRVI